MSSQLPSGSLSIPSLLKDDSETCYCSPEHLVHYLGRHPEHPLLTHFQVLCLTIFVWYIWAVFGDYVGWSILALCILIVPIATSWIAFFVSDSAIRILVTFQTLIMATLVALACFIMEVVIFFSSASCRWRGQWESGERCYVTAAMAIYFGAVLLAQILNVVAVSLTFVRSATQMPTRLADVPR